MTTLTTTTTTMATLTLSTMTAMAILDKRLDYVDYSQAPTWNGANSVMAFSANLRWRWSLGGFAKMTALGGTGMRASAK